jgi:hypothetical protein
VRCEDGKNGETGDSGMNATEIIVGKFSKSYLFRVVKNIRCFGYAKYNAV